MGREEFAKKYEYRPEKPVDITKYQGKHVERNNIQRRTRRYIAPKGTAHSARANRKRGKFKARVAALILAATVGLGGITLANNSKDVRQEAVTITSMQEDGINLANRGLSEETIALYEKYDEYFGNFNPKGTNNLTDNDILNMISEIRDLHFLTVKERMGATIGENKEDLTMYYGADKSDGEEWASVIANEDSYNREVYSSRGNLFGIGNKNHIPDELADAIWQLDSLDSLKTRLLDDKITKLNAVKELMKIYRELEEVAMSDFIIDEKGNISIIQYEPNIEREDAGRDEEK